MAIFGGLVTHQKLKTLSDSESRAEFDGLSKKKNFDLNLTLKKFKNDLFSAKRNFDLFKALASIIFTI